MTARKDGHLSPISSQGSDSGGTTLRHVVSARVAIEIGRRFLDGDYIPCKHTPDLA